MAERFPWVSPPKRARCQALGITGTVRRCWRSVPGGKLIKSRHVNEPGGGLRAAPSPIRGRNARGERAKPYFCGAGMSRHKSQRIRRKMLTSAAAAANCWVLRGRGTNRRHRILRGDSDCGVFILSSAKAAFFSSLRLFYPLALATWGERRGFYLDASSEDAPMGFFFLLLDGP